MIVLGHEQQEAVQRLRENRDWQRIGTLLADTYERELENLLRATNPVTVHQQQGACQALKDILRLFGVANPSPSARLG